MTDLPKVSYSMTDSEINIKSEQIFNQKFNYTCFFSEIA